MVKICATTPKLIKFLNLKLNYAHDIDMIIKAQIETAHFDQFSHVYLEILCREDRQ